MKREDWTVGEHGIRPAGPQDACLYCRAKISDQHGAECVIRQRTVVIRMTMEYVIDVPESWTPEQIEFHRNDASWCANNAIAEIQRVIAGACLCPYAKFEFVREATELDERRSNLAVATLPT